MEIQNELSCPVCGAPVEDPEDFIDYHTDKHASDTWCDKCGVHFYVAQAVFRRFHVSQFSHELFTHHTPTQPPERSDDGS